ncbi:MAG: hypothetical protein Q9167_002041 [Letrouitia subvulpina]
MGELPFDPPTSQEAPGTSAKVFEEWRKQVGAPGRSTNTALLTSLRSRYLGWNVTVTSNHPTGLLTFAKAGYATATLDSKHEANIADRKYKAARGRKSENKGNIKTDVTFGKYDYSWNGHSFIVYHASFMEDERNHLDNFYILSKRPDGEAAFTTETPKAVDDLIIASTKWNAELHDEILVFDQQMWTKDKELYRAVKSANWDDVILDENMKEALIQDVGSFFDCEKDYKRFAVPWKRGIIFHGTPGNGKTISIKALMNSLSTRKDPIPSLYVKSLAGCNNAWYAIRQIFVTARHYSPCLLIFEDLDSLIGDNVKSFFLNEVDGLEDNDGLMMIGSTNYLERLDAGISKRPGRFDRKYHFSLPEAKERTMYCEYWRRKLASADNDLEFPDHLSGRIAEITAEFSFAYIKEAFVTSLLTIVGAQKGARSLEIEEKEEGEEKDEMEKVLLWRVLKKQVKNLRVEIEGARKSAEEAVDTGKEAQKGEIACSGGC